MDDLILVCGLVLIGGTGFYIVKLLDFFQSRVMEKSLKIRIACEHAEDCAALQHMLKKSFPYLDCKDMKIFYGSEELIKDNMKKRAIDIAVIESDHKISEEDHVFCKTIYLPQESFEYQDTGILVSSLSSEKVKRMMIWGKSRNPDLNRFVQTAVSNSIK